MSALFLILAFSFNSGANILLKLAAEKGLRLQGFNPVVLARENFLILAALVSFGLNFIFYFLALRNISLSVAYPVMNVMSIIIIYAFAVWYFHERLTAWQTIGYGFLLVGLVMIFYFGKR